LEPEIFHELAKDLAIERNVFVIVGVLGACAARAPRQRQGQRDGRGRRPQPLRMSVPHKLSPSNYGKMCRLPARYCGQDQGAFAAPGPNRVRKNSRTTRATRPTSER